MDRRRFLRLTAAGGAAALVLPGWLSRAFAQEPPRPEGTTSLPTLVTAFRDAQRMGKPLLVLVVPTDAAASGVRARAFGELLNYGGDDAMRDLSLAHVVCAKMDEVRTLAPQTRVSPAEPLMVLIETDAVPARVTPLDATLPGADRIWDSTEQDIDARISVLSNAVHAALARDAAMVAARARVARAHLDAQTLTRVDAALRGAQLDKATADRAAALVYTAPSLRAPLVAGATERLRTSRVPGSLWAASTGCGVDIEGGEPSMVDCGMGHVPPRSARFLYFYVRH